MKTSVFSSVFLKGEQRSNVSPRVCEFAHDLCFPKEPKDVEAELVGNTGAAKQAVALAACCWLLLALSPCSWLPDCSSRLPHWLTSRNGHALKCLTLLRPL